jgi:uncharacterized protein (DUF433 family)
MRTSLRTKPLPHADLSEHLEPGPAGDAYPKGSRISVKHIAYLYMYCNKHPRDIKSQYPCQLSEADVHLALAHYFLNREDFDAQIKRDRELNAKDALSQNGRLPRVGVNGLLEALEIEARPPVEKSTLVKW